MIAFYMRLSEADRDGKDGPSCSIESQELMLAEYVEEHEDLAGQEIARFADDGWSGATMERPQLQALLEACRRREVDCVLVKDYSRLSRNYLDAGDLVERIFPMLGVRFIAIAEGYDSARYVPADDGFLMGFKNIVNASFSRDLSMRISASLRNSWKNGEHVHAMAPFGYVYDKDARGHLKPDPIASNYVRRIFELACKDGASTGAVAAKLNEEDIPTPAVYARMAGEGPKQNMRKPKRAAWNAHKVNRILHMETYTGTLVGGLTKKASGIGHGSPRRTSRVDERVRTEDAHEAIVTREQFLRAQACFKNRHPEGPVTKGAPGMFTGLVFCPECGWAARTVREEKRPKGYMVDCDCGGDAYIGEWELERAVRESLRMQADVLGLELTRVTARVRAGAPARNAAARGIARCERDIDRLRAERMDAYERMLAGDVKEASFQRANLAIAEKIAEREGELARLRAELDERSADERRRAELAGLARDMGGIDLKRPLCRELVERLVRRIDMDSDGAITVTFAFADSLEGGDVL